MTTPELPAPDTITHGGHDYDIIARYTMDYGSDAKRRPLRFTVEVIRPRPEEDVV